jgi:hypothetical protein
MTRSRVIDHPGHPGLTPPGEPLPEIPPEPRGWAGFKARRACRKAGGHYWHPVNPMIGWGCCGCGARDDGMPWDGN